MKYPEVKIETLADPKPGSFKIGPFGSSLKKDELVVSGIPVAGIENILPNNFITSFRKFITKTKFKQLSDYEVKPGDILVTTMGTIGRAAVVPDGVGTAIIDSHLFRMRVDQSQIYPPYLCYAINGYEGLKRQLAQMSRGAIMDGLNTTILKECKIPLPPLAEQKRIAAIAQKADRLRRTRRYALQLSDTYLQSVFLEMFGDPALSFDIVEIEEIVAKSTYALSSGPFGSNLTSEHYIKNGVPVLRGLNISKGKLNLEDLKFVSEEKAKELARSEVKPGDIVVVAVGSSGLACQIPRELSRSIMSQNFNKITPDLQKINGTYLEYCINSSIVQRQIQQEITDTVRTFLSLTKLKTVKIPLPPLPLQEKFAQIVQKFERLRTQQREAERQAEHLFQTILHRAFRGELTSSDINEEPADRLEQNPPKLTKPETTVKNPDSNAKQQYTEAIQLKLPGFE